MQQAQHKRRAQNMMISGIVITIMCPTCHIQIAILDTGQAAQYVCPRCRNPFQV